MGRGRVGFYRQPRNLGIYGNVNACVQRATRDIVHLLNADDLVHPTLYRRLAERLHAYPEVAGGFTRSYLIDRDGNITGLSPSLAPLGEGPTYDPSPLYYDHRIRTPGAAVRRSFYEQHGGYVEKIIYAADWEMWIRVVGKGGAVTLDEPLAYYRTHSANASTRMLRTGDDLRDHLRVGNHCARLGLAGFDLRRFRQVVRDTAEARLVDALASGDRAAYRAARRLCWEAGTPQQRLHDAIGVLSGRQGF